jgi:hypothetical protein
MGTLVSKRQTTKWRMTTTVHLLLLKRLLKRPTSLTSRHGERLRSLMVEERLAAAAAMAMAAAAALLGAWVVAANHQENKARSPPQGSEFGC